MEDMRYRSARGHARFAMWGIVLDVVVTGSLVAALGGQAMLIGVPIDQAPPSAATGAVALGMCCSGISVIGALVIAATLFLVWLHRAYSSAIALGAEISYTPGYAVGSWFIPIVNLWQPLQVVQALDAAAAPEDRLENVATQHDTTLWWGLWIGTGIAGVVSHFAQQAGPMAWFVAEIFVLALRAGCALFIVRIIARITENLERKAQQAGVASPVPLQF